MLSKLLGRLEARIGRHRGIRNLMSFVIAGMVIVFLGDYILPVFMKGMTFSSMLSFNRAKIMSGQVWRLVTFIFVPTASANLLLLAIGLYFDWLMGEMLQNHWGTLRFTIFYITGMIGAVIGGFITGYASSYYLNMSLMLAMACIMPDMELNLYGFLKVRLKWLALFSVAMMVLPMMQVFTWQHAAGLIASLINVILFFADKVIGHARTAWRHHQWKRNWRGGWKR